MATVPFNIVCGRETQDQSNQIRWTKKKKESLIVFFSLIEMRDTTNHSNVLHL